MPTGLHRTYGALSPALYHPFLLSATLCEFAEEWRMKSRTKISFRALGLNQPVAQALLVSPFAKKAKDGHPSVLVMPTRSRVRATRQIPGIREDDGTNFRRQ
jgi:hypothetical protein